uniref:Keratin 18a, tandem duplicate 1 n=1 Tax=Takifugu rubripes TaxID=31033 RepID=A0A674PM12_TAKRU
TNFPLRTHRVSTATMKSTYSVYSSSASSRAPTASMMRASTGPVYRAATVHGGAASGSRISSGSGGFTSTVQVSGNNAKYMGNEKFAMQNLNERLASYIETVRNLEQANHSLELKITEAFAKYPYYLVLFLFEVLDATTDNARLVLNIDNARLAADDFKVKYESELAIRQSVEADIVGLRKVIDDTNMARMNLESEIEALKEELIHLKKNHEQLHNQIAKSGVHVDVDARKGQDLAQLMAEIRSKYENIAQKNQEELKAWHESQIIEVRSQVAQKPEALKCAQTEVNDLHRQIQTLEIDLSHRGAWVSLEGTLRDTEMYDPGTGGRAYSATYNIQLQTQDYEALLNTKMKLEVEIATYRQLLDGENFTLQDALDQKTSKTKIMTVTQTLVDGKVVSSSNTETKEV